jgi:hypothetical protein
MNLKLYGSEKFDPKQIMRFEKYVDSKYPMFHFRKRRQYAKGVLKYQNIKLIESHIYPGVKIWDSSPTLAARLAAALKKLAVRLKESINVLKYKKQLQKIKLVSWIRGSVKNLVGQAPVIIGARDGLGGKRTITGTLAKAFHLMNRLLNTLGLSLRLNPSGFAVRILRVKPKLQHKEGVCEICDHKLGHWYTRKEIVPFLPDMDVHYLCLLPTEKEGVLL